jgi:hypothetical protein
LSTRLQIENLAGTHTKSYRIEEVPSDQLHLADNEMLVPVGHYQGSILQNYVSAE